ncbi:hypothetical protein CYMTET_22415 [Cymbomonas tetramitiformis]|uniref:monoamine oxidase n=1 Tax=Cymbomonas tetramitiformis TaxID=36881 RepID=A0AAE0G1B2_9CHLO|nr:hypothetical protein CYMTET_22415 [Cymbomonas tetramitiformis]|eukprot:gene9151-10844_t
MNLPQTLAGAVCALFLLCNVSRAHKEDTGGSRTKDDAIDGRNGEDVEVDLVIVGAGWAGLSAAHALLEHNRASGNAAPISFHVLEAAEHVGGRALNQDVVSGAQSTISDDVVELGGEWLAPQHTAAIRMIRDVMGYPLFHRKYNVRMRSRKLKRWPRRNRDIQGKSPAEIKDAGLRIIVHTSAGTRYCDTQDEIVGTLPQDVQRIVKDVNASFAETAQTVSCENPLESQAKLRQWDAMSFASWLWSATNNTEARTILAALADDAEELQAISYVGALWTYNCTADLIGGDDEDFYRVRGGTQGPLLSIYDRVSDNVTLSSPVWQVVSSKDSVTVTSKRRSVKAKRVLLTGPPSALLGIQMDPPLTGDKAQLLSHMPLGTSLKYFVVYDQPWWRKLGYLGKIVTATTPPYAHRALFISECLDNSPFSWSRGVMLCFIEGSENRRFMREYTKEQRKALVLDFLAYSFKDPQAKTGARSVIEHNWADQPWTRGAYSTYFPPGVLTEFWDEWKDIRHPAERLWVAGTDYAYAGLGYIEGAITTALDATEQMIAEFTKERHGKEPLAVS